jgi:ectoine hydroxylase-related dioxygenase (phytanoyl-CoA dioxygenase family)
MEAFPRLPAGCSFQDVANALVETGAAIVENHLASEQLERLRVDLAPALDRPESEFRANATFASFGTNEFLPANTRRTTGLVARSPTFRALIADPLVLRVCDAILKPNCSVYQVHATSALDIGPGATEQMLHREDDAFPHLPDPHPELLVASMWAVDEFTEENGATRLVPGSHRWPRERNALSGEVRVAAMPPGAVALWLGRTLHGAGANVSSGRRLGVYLSMSLGWLRQEENQYLSVPPSIAGSFSDELRRLIGYQLHDPGLGYWADVEGESKG